MGRPLFTWKKKPEKTIFHTFYLGINNKKERESKIESLSVKTNCFSFYFDICFDPLTNDPKTFAIVYHELDEEGNMNRYLKFQNLNEIPKTKNLNHIRGQNQRPLFHRKRKTIDSDIRIYLS